MNFLKQHKFLFTLIIFLAVLSFALPIITVLAQTSNMPSAVNVGEVISNLNTIATGPAGMKDYNLTAQVGKYIGLLLQGLGALLLGLVIFASIRWMIARDNEEEVTKAKDLLRDGAIGFVIVLIAFLLTQFVWGSIFNAITGRIEPTTPISGSVTNQDNSSIRCEGTNLDGKVGDYFCTKSCYSDVVTVIPVPVKDVGCENIGLLNTVCCFEENQ